MTDDQLSLKTVVEGIGGALLIAATILFSPLLRPKYRRWGLTDAEVGKPMPGDRYVPRPKSEVNCAMTIHAPAAQIWPWFVQLGCQRGGWYSYDLLDNGGKPSANRILPDHQHLEVGDFVKAIPNGSFGFPVAEIEPEKALVLAGTLNTKTGQPAGPNDPALEAYFSGLQAFLLEEIRPGVTRLYFHCRMDWNPSLANTIMMGLIFEPVSFIMGRKMLANLKRLVESAVQQAALPQAS